jgi:hypothetical protein
MAASPWHLAHLDVARQDAAPRRLRASAAFCDAHPDDAAQVGAVNWLSTNRSLPMRGHKQLVARHAVFTTTAMPMQHPSDDYEGWRRDWAEVNRLVDEINRLIKL